MMRNIIVLVSLLVIVVAIQQQQKQQQGCVNYWIDAFTTTTPTTTTITATNLDYQYNNNNNNNKYPSFSLSSVLSLRWHNNKFIKQQQYRGSSISGVTTVSTTTRSSLSTTTSSDTDDTTTTTATTTTEQEELSQQNQNQQQQYTYFSPCKINLFLRILRKREIDGYHDLASLFQAIGFGDTITMIPINMDMNDGTTIPNEVVDTQQQTQLDIFTCNMEGVPTDSTNLVLRAIQLMRNKTTTTSSSSASSSKQQQQQYFNVNLYKECPAQAGLGGGSANAATAMYAYNEIMGRPATIQQMIEWSGELGSDITFFLSHGTAYCTGRGEIMTPIDPPLVAGTEVCIVKLKNIGLSTPTVFKALNYSKLSQIDPDTVLLPAFINAQNGDVTNVPNEYYINDLEEPAFQCIPQLQVLKDQLQQVQGFTHVMMSGSGTSIFCIGTPVDMKQFNTTFCIDRNDLQIYFSEFINRPIDGWYQRP